MAAFAIAKLKAQLEEARTEAQSLLAIGEDGSVQSREARFPYTISDSGILSVLDKSGKALQGFVTLDISLVTAIDEVLQDFQDYINDKTRKRPHNLLMLAEPGGGKSHLVSCLARSLELPLVSGNLSAADSAGVLTHVANEARNFKAQDSVPLVFLDEVDSNPLHYSTLLPLLWDGELFVLGQSMKVGRCIVVCAARRSNVETHLTPSEPVVSTKTAHSAKVSDFLSRFDAGTLEIHSINSDERSLDKLVIAAKLLRQRFSDAKYVSLGLLQFFSHLPVRHEVRSLEFMVNLIPSDSVQALPSDAGKECSIKPNEGFVSLSQTWNSPLRERFTRLLQGRSEFSDLLGFHISVENRAMAEQIWHLYQNNIGLLCLHDD